jgi:tRNA threonylcarbamoyladenosine biosynthesis protein TsaE
MSVAIAGLEDLQRFTQAFAPCLQADDWILLEGQMGAGKTTFTRALVAAMGGNPDAVSSPSYALMNGYEASMPIWHIDAWRMSSDEDFDNLGLDDFGEGALVLIEWPSRIPSLADLPAVWRIELTVASEHKRQLHISVPPGRTAMQWPTQVDEGDNNG